MQTNKQTHAYIHIHRWTCLYLLITVVLAVVFLCCWKVASLPSRHTRNVEQLSTWWADDSQFRTNLQLLICDNT